MRTVRVSGRISGGARLVLIFLWAFHPVFSPGSACAEDSGYYKASEPTLPPHARLGISVDASSECALHAECFLPVAFLPGRPGPKMPEGYPADGDIRIDTRFDVYRYDLSGTAAGELELPSRSVLKQEELDRSSSSPGLFEGARIGKIPLRAKAEGEWQGEIRVTNPKSKKVDSFTFAVLSENKRVYMGASIPEILRALPPGIRLPAVKERFTLARKRWHAKLPDVSLDAVCKSDVTRKDFDIVASVERCKSATDALHAAASVEPFKQSMTGSYVQRRFRVARVGAITQAIGHFGEHFDVLPYTPIRITAETRPPAVITLLTKGAITNTLGRSSVKSHEDTFCRFNPGNKSCPRGPDADGKLRIVDIILEDGFSVNLVAPRAAADSPYRIEIEELEEFPE